MRVRVREVVGVGVLLGLGALVVQCLPTSTSSLVERADDLPGVIKVEAREADGDDAIPFQTIPKEVKVVMRASATAAQMQRVLDKYDDDIDDGEVDRIDLFLKGGGKPGRLSIGEGVKVEPAVVDQLAEAMRDDAVAAYYREAYPVVPTVGVTLRSGGFPAVLRAADRYGSVGMPGLVEVRANEFLLIRADDDNRRRGAAREAFTLEAARKVRLEGAVVSDHGPLRLYVGADDVASVRRWVDRAAPPQVGRVAVLTGTPDPTAGDPV